MLNLTDETLIPGRTILKRRDGDRVVYINDETSIIRVCKLGSTSGSYVVKKADGKIGSIDASGDMVAIARLRELQPGDTVLVNGMIFCPNVGMTPSQAFVADMEVRLIRKVDELHCQHVIGKEFWEFSSSDLVLGHNYTFYVNRRDLTFVRRDA